VLDELLTILEENPTIIIELGSHTDAIGSDESNLKLSQARAQSCVDYLVSKGVSKGRLTAKGYGESMPIAPNENEDGSDNEEGRQKNRRTEFKVLESF
jgi:outer membrane protein OmpA-like peptidoglycan-associated protein